MTDIINRVISRALSLTMLITFSMLNVSLAYAETGRTFEVPAKKDEIEEVRFKDEMEARLNRDLKAYLGNNRFIIHVEAELKKTRTVIKQEGTRNSQNSPPRPVFSAQPMPAIITDTRINNTRNSNGRNSEPQESLPGLPTSDLPIFEDNSAEVNALKGRVEQLENERQQALNYAEELRKEAEQQIAEIKEKTLGYRNSINKLTITVVLDKSLKDEQVEFIRNLITRKARLDELRGDSLAIVRTEFKDVVKPDVVTSWWQQYQGWIALASFGLMMLLLLLALYLFNKRLTDTFQENQRKNTHDQNSNDQSSTGNSLLASTDMAALNNAQDETQERRRQFNEMRQELVTIGLGQPQLFQQRISEQINNLSLIHI